MLVTKGILNDRTSKTYLAFTNHISTDFTTIPIMTPSEYVKYCWDLYKGSPYKDDVNGSIFEVIIATLLYREKILPFYTQAEVSFVPNAAFDILLYRNDGKIIALSLKTSLRERYKQTALEGMALLNVHRLASNYLVTLQETTGRNKNAPKNLQDKIDNHEVLFIDKVITANTTILDDFIRELKKYRYKKAPRVPVISDSSYYVKK